MNIVLASTESVSFGFGNTLEILLKINLSVSPQSESSLAGLVQVVLFFLTLMKIN